mmetsp:Transcript_25044/g.29619  ORF Transcript_25044/g.29619 Transcript_25044/m.29619 type:complete len:2121 (-) Transcript_25044:168-6530(-)
MSAIERIRAAAAKTNQSLGASTPQMGNEDSDSDSDSSRSQSYDPSSSVHHPSSSQTNAALQRDKDERDDDEEEGDDDDDKTITSIDDNGNKVDYDKTNDKEKVYNHMGDVPEVRVIANPRAAEVLRVTGRYSHLKLVESIHAISVTTQSSGAASPPLTSFDLRGIWRASHAAYELSVSKGSSVTARRKASNASKSLSRARRKIARRVLELSETKELLYHSAPIAADPLDYTFAMSAGGSPLWRDLRADWMLPPVPPARLMHHVLDAVAELEAVCAHHCADHPFLAAVSVLPSWGRLPVALMNRKHVKVTRPALITHMPQMNVANVSSNVVKVSSSIANSAAMKSLVSQARHVATTVKNHATAGTHEDTNDNDNDDNNEKEEVDDPHGDSKKKDEKGDEKDSEPKDVSNRDDGLDETKKSSELTSLKSLPLAEGKENICDDSQDKKNQNIKMDEDKKDKQTDKIQPDEQINNINEIAEPKRRNSLESANNDRDTHSISGGLKRRGSLSNIMGSGGGGTGTGGVMLSSVIDTEEESRKSRLALHMMTRDFPRPEALVDMVQPNEAMVTWITSEDGRLLAVLVYREKILVKADPFGRPMGDPNNAGGVKLVGGHVHDQLKAAGGFWGKVADNFAQGQKDVDKGVEKAQKAKVVAKKFAHQVKTKTDTHYSHAKTAYKKMEKRRAERASHLHNHQQIDEKTNTKSNKNKQNKDKEDDADSVTSDISGDELPTDVTRRDGDNGKKRGTTLKGVAYSGVALRGLLNQVSNKKSKVANYQSEDSDNYDAGDKSAEGENNSKQGSKRDHGTAGGAPIQGGVSDDYYGDYDYSGGGGGGETQDGTGYDYGGGGGTQDGSGYDYGGDYGYGTYGGEEANTAAYYGEAGGGYDYYGDQGQEEEGASDPYAADGGNDFYAKEEGEGEDDQYDFSSATAQNMNPNTNYNQYNSSAAEQEYNNDETGDYNAYYGDEMNNNDENYNQNYSETYDDNSDGYNKTAQSDYNNNGDEYPYQSPNNKESYNNEISGGISQETNENNNETNAIDDTIKKESFIEMKRREFKLKESLMKEKLNDSKSPDYSRESTTTTEQNGNDNDVIMTKKLSFNLPTASDESKLNYANEGTENDHEEGQGKEVGEEEEEEGGDDEDADVCSMPADIRVRLCVGAADGVDHLNKQVQKFLDAVRGNKSLQNTLDEISPILGVEAWVDAIPDHVTALTIILPAVLSPLSIIPFHALAISGGSHQILGDKFALRTASSISLHTLSEAQSTIPPAEHLRRMVIVAEPTETIERRIDHHTGIAYSLEEFVEFYGGTREWHMAPKENPFESFRENDEVNESAEVKCLRDLWSQIEKEGGEPDDWAIAFPTSDLQAVQTPPPRALLESYKKKEIARLRNQELQQAEKEAQTAIMASRVATTRANNDKRKLEKKRKQTNKKSKSKAFRKKQKKKQGGDEESDSDEEEDDLIFDDADFEAEEDDDEDEEESIFKNGRDVLDIFRKELTSPYPTSHLSSSLSTARVVHFNVPISYSPNSPAIHVPSTALRGKGFRFTCADILSKMYLKHCGLVVFDKGGICNQIANVSDLSANKGISFGGCGSIEDSLLIAGARSVIYPLWTTKIGYFCNELIMFYFYSILGDELNMLEGYNIAVALSDAQYWLRTSSYDDFRKAIYNQKKLSNKARLDLVRKLDSHLNEFDGVGSEIPFQDPLWWASFRIIGAGKGSHNFKATLTPPTDVEKKTTNDDGGEDKDQNNEENDNALGKIEENSSEEEDEEDEEGREEEEEDGGIEAQQVSEEFTLYMKKRGELEEGETMEKVMNQWMKEKTAKVQHEAMIEKKHRDVARAKNTAQRTLAQAQKRREEARKQEEARHKTKMNTAQDRKREAQEKKDKAAAAYKRKILQEVEERRKDKESNNKDGSEQDVKDSEIMKTQPDEMKNNTNAEKEEDEEEIIIATPTPTETLPSSFLSSQSKSQYESIIEHESENEKSKKEVDRNDHENNDDFDSHDENKKDDTKKEGGREEEEDEHEKDEEDDDDLWARLEREENERLNEKEKEEPKESETDFWARMEKEEQEKNGGGGSELTLEERIKMRKEAKQGSSQKETKILKNNSLSKDETYNNTNNNKNPKSETCLVM